jgi:outer membrane protein
VAVLASFWSGPALADEGVSAWSLGLRVGQPEAEVHANASKLSGFELRLTQAHLEEDLSRANLYTAMAALLPKISVGADWVIDGDIRYRPDIAAAQPGTLAKRDPSTIGAELSWRLFDGFQNVSTIGAARETLAWSFQASIDARQKLLLEKAEIGLRLMRDRQIRSAYAAAVESRQKAYDIVERMFSVGSMTASDRARAGSELEGARALLEQANSLVATTEIDYRRFIGEKPTADLSVRVPSDRIPASADAAEKRALTNSPLPRMAAHLERSADYRVRATAANFAPTVDLVGRYTRTFDPSPPVDRVDNYALLVRLRMPIFDASLTPALSAARAEAAQRRYDRIDTVRSLAAEARKQYELHHSLAAQARSLDRQVQLAQRAVAAVQIEIKAGVRTVSELLDADEDLLSARVALAGAHYDGNLAAFRLLATTADLDEGGPHGNRAAH